MRTAALAAILVMVAALPAAVTAQTLQMAPELHVTPWCGAVVESVGALDQADPVGLPASFSWAPDGITSVKNQGGCGSCWAFASYGSMESNVLVEGDGTTWDLSENHLKNYHGFDPGPCYGGNIWMSMAYMSRLDGPVAEADDPYHDYDDRPSPGGPRQLTLGACTLHAPDDIKQAVMDHGALHTSMYWTSSAYNSSTATYRYTGGTSTNHGVAIIGWDDAKAVPGAAAPGAWQIKNSWGAGFGQSGLFWISYEDTAACNYGAAFQAAPVGAVKDCYYHDDFGAVSYVNNPYALNVFQATSDDPLKAVGLTTYQAATSYVVRVYDTFTGGAPSGLLTEAVGYLADEGFHIVDLDEWVSVQDGDDFAVYVEFINGGQFPSAFDFAYTGYSSAATAAPGQSYYSFDGATWTDLTTYDPTANYCIKAYTAPEPATAALLLAGALALVRRRR